MRKHFQGLFSRWLLLALLALAGRAAGQPAARPAKTDSLKQVLATATDTLRVKTLHELVAQAASGDYAQAMVYARRELAESRRLGWPPGQAQGLEDLARLY